MGRNTFTAIVRTQIGGAKNVAGQVVLAAPYSFDPTSSAGVKLFTLPAGAIPLNAISRGGATGGTSPTINIGTTGTATAFASGLRADIFSTSGSGTASGVELTADTDVYGKVGASAATGGTVAGYLLYALHDDGMRAGRSA